jgi:hypothetical protein
LTRRRPTGTPPEPIPQAVLGFLRSEIESVRELETLLALRSSATTVTAEALAATLRSATGWTEQQLDGLHAKGLVSISTDDAGPPCYGYAPPSAEVAGVVDAVADAFARRRSTVIRLIFDDSDQDVLRTFADAFRVRRDDDDD